MLFPYIPCYGLELRTFVHLEPFTTCVQVFKFSSGSPSGEPLLTLGVLFQPGGGSKHFCKPAAVAVEQEFFYVADGYCNSRVVKFKHDGSVAQVWDHAIEGRSLLVAHSLTLLRPQNILLLADRENGRIIAYHTEDGEGTVFYRDPAGEGAALYAVSLTAAGDWPLYSVSVESGRRVSSPGSWGLTLGPEGKPHSTWGVEVRTCTCEHSLLALVTVLTFDPCNIAKVKQLICMLLGV